MENNLFQTYNNEAGAARNNYFPLQKNMYLTFLLAIVCDRDTAKQQVYRADDIINNPQEDLKDFTTKSPFRIVGETYGYIPCGGDCAFTTHSMTLCFKFKNKMDVCMLNRNVDGEHNFFNIGKFVLIITASYMDWAMRFKNPDDANYFSFGNRRELENGNVGHSVMIQDLKIQLAYKPIIKPIGQQDLARVIQALQNAPAQPEPMQQ